MTYDDYVMADEALAGEMDTDARAIAGLLQAAKFIFRPEWQEKINEMAINNYCGRPDLLLKAMADLVD